MGLIKTAAKVAVASSVHGRVQRRQQQRWAAQDAAAAGAATPQQPPAHFVPPAEQYAAPTPAPAHVPAAPPTPPADDMQAKVDLLRQLGELRDSGVLTDAEFEAKKAEILG